MIVESLVEIIRDTLHWSAAGSYSSSSPIWLPAFMTVIASVCAVVGLLAASVRRNSKKQANSSNSTTQPTTLLHLSSEVESEDPALRHDNGPQLLRRHDAEKADESESGSENEANSDNEDDDGDDDDRPAPGYLPKELQAPRIPYNPLFEVASDRDMIDRSAEFLRTMWARRSVRTFDSARAVPQQVMDNIIKCAGSAPSGSNLQPWTYVVIDDQHMKAEVRRIIEEEEEMNYKRRMGEKWVRDVSRLGTDWNKPYLEEAPYLVIVMKQTHSDGEKGTKQTHYYCDLSVSISVGMLLCAVQHAGLVSVTTTPLNAGPRLRTLLNRPSNEKVLLLLPIGFPSPDCNIPDIKRKPLDEIMIKI